MAPIDMPLLILAAGASRRMRGQDKLLNEVDGMPLLRRQALMARDVTSGPIFVMLPTPPHPRYAAIEDLDVRSVAVPDASEGMNASLRAGLNALPHDAPCAMLLLADLPDLKAHDLKKVADAVELKSGNLIWRGATSTGAAGHPVVFHADLFAPLRALSGDSGAKEVVETVQDQTVLIPLAGDRARHDLDTPEAWAAWRARVPD